MRLVGSPVYIWERRRPYEACRRLWQGPQPTGTQPCLAKSLGEKAFELLPPSIPR